MSRVMELDEQIRKLQEEKDRIYAEERKAALSDIRDKIALFAFSPKELGLKLPKGGTGGAERPAKAAGRKPTRKAAKAPKSSGLYFDLGGRKVPAGRGRPPKDVTAYAAEKGVSTDSLKFRADGTPFAK